jgi:hypothetical protein
MAVALRNTYRQLRRRISKTFVRVPVVWLRHRGLSDQDVFVAAYARTGSVWLRFLLYEILAGKSAGFDLVNRHIPDVGLQRSSLPLLPNGGRVIKTHEPYRGEYRKAIYLVRDPRDIILSEYAFYKQSRRINSDEQVFLRQFLQGKSNGYGPWSEHVRSWLQSPIAANGNLLVVKFEDLKQQPEAGLRRILEFLGIAAEDSALRAALADNTVARMRQKELQSPNLITREGHHYIRGGLVGGWRENLSPTEVELIERQSGEMMARMGYELAATRAPKELSSRFNDAR